MTWPCPIIDMQWRVIKAFNENFGSIIKSITTFLNFLALLDQNVIIICLQCWKRHEMGWNTVKNVITILISDEWRLRTCSVEFIYTASILIKFVSKCFTET